MIARAQLHQTNTDGYETEASTIGLRPGQWPATLEVEGLGTFARRTLDAAKAIYAHPTTGAILRVYND